MCMHVCVFVRKSWLSLNRSICQQKGCWWRWRCSLLQAQPSCLRASRRPFYSCNSEGFSCPLHWPALYPEAHVPPVRFSLLQLWLICWLVMYTRYNLLHIFSGTQASTKGLYIDSEKSADHCQSQATNKIYVIILCNNRYIYIHKI